MNPEFKIDSTRYNVIADTFGIGVDDVKKLHEEFASLEVKMKKHRLTHISRVLESFFRKATGNNKFFIEYVPYSDAVSALRPRGASAVLDVDFTKFTIFYDKKNFEERDIRINISHELGHLYLRTKYYLSNTGKGKYVPKLDHTAEPLSSIFGLFVVSNKNHFYENLVLDKQKHNNWQEILDDFKKQFFAKKAPETVP